MAKYKCSVGQRGYATVDDYRGNESTYQTLKKKEKDRGERTSPNSL